MSRNMTETNVTLPDARTDGSLKGAKSADILIAAGVAEAAELPLSSCRITKPYLLERLGFVPTAVAIGIIPYYTKACDEKRTVSAYAVGRDYHALAAEIGQKAARFAAAHHPNAHVACFSDHSPIAEVEAAARAGLGVIGMNGLLITKKYSSYVFITELFTDIETDAEPRVAEYCERCGRCRTACPSRLCGFKECLSAITQKKGELGENEKELMRRYGTAWGCDVCQEVCPHTVKAKKDGTIYTDSEFFNQQPISVPTEETIADKADFAKRAYSWRGAATILRNVKILKND